jgi:hypothetical protein
MLNNKQLMKIQLPLQEAEDMPRLLTEVEPNQENINNCSQGDHD